MLNIEGLKVGDKLVCVDHKGYGYPIADVVIVTLIEPTQIWVNGEIVLHRSELEHFKKKEQPTFNDLIDVAVQAFKDGVITGFDISKDLISYFTKKRWDRKRLRARKCLGIHGLSDDSKAAWIEKEIGFIKSLYKETFVIETESDIKKIKQNAKILLQNGNCFVVDQPVVNGIIRRTMNNGTYDYMVLCGATVEQERVSNE